MEGERIAEYKLARDWFIEIGGKGAFLGEELIITDKEAIIVGTYEVGGWEFYPVELKIHHVISPWGQSMPLREALLEYGEEALCEWEWEWEICTTPETRPIEEGEPSSIYGTIFQSIVAKYWGYTP